jgi:uncharacterized C2H2 Zn-finger protein
MEALFDMVYSKHEKTHSRPWKCNESNCKYHQFGWPTEKERDRHVNDKHSVTPSLYKCQYHPCPYESKRESNCKQHMEKAHGWAYIRSKNNGKAGKKVPTAKAPITPPAASPESYILDAASLDLSAVSGYLNPHDGSRVAHPVDGSVAATEDSANYLISGIPFTRRDVNHRPLDPYFSLDDTYADLASPGRSDHLFNTDQSSWDEIPVTNAQTSPSAFEASLTLQDPDILFSENFDWSNLNSDFTSYNMQLITPASSVDTRPRDSFSRNPSFSQEKLPDFQVTSLSPGAQDVMLYSPYSNDDGSKDEGYDDFISETGNPESDFALFDCSSRPAASYMCTLDKRNMFQDLATLVPSAWSGRGTDLAQQLGINELMQIDDD